jgi:imidazolonepropionase-like amidohydrolase
MLRTGIFLVTFLINSAFSLNANAATKAIKLGRLWDGHGVIANATVIVESDRVERVTAGDEIPVEAEVIDLRRYTGIPGMIDSHTHHVLLGRSARHDPSSSAATARCSLSFPGSGEREEDA